MGRNSEGGTLGRWLERLGCSTIETKVEVSKEDEVFSDVFFLCDG
jgi:hypothetical protein